mmetsp:Transcript_34511/g.81820  ORF Transcript_34511/g.81820 Transcript_34511/m.81820 type:complete len:275 (-) Transcript_34511:480-1304(-)
MSSSFLLVMLASERCSWISISRSSLACSSDRSSLLSSAVSSIKRVVIMVFVYCCFSCASWRMSFTALPRSMGGSSASSIPRSVWILSSASLMDSRPSAAAAACCTARLPVTLRLRARLSFPACCHHFPGELMHRCLEYSSHCLVWTMPTSSITPSMAPDSPKGPDACENTLAVTLTPSGCSSTMYSSWVLNLAPPGICEIGVDEISSLSLSLQRYSCVSRTGTRSRPANVLRNAGRDSGTSMSTTRLPSTHSVTPTSCWPWNLLWNSTTAESAA